MRVNDDGHWYGEGEIKIYRDGDRDFPTICGTGLEDYAGSAWGIGAHATLCGGAPLVIPPPADPASAHSLAELWRNTSEFVGFYRWHLLDPVMFERELRVTIQQIGGAYFGEGQENEYEHFVQTHRPAGRDFTCYAGARFAAGGNYERQDDYCATGFVYCSAPQSVPRVDIETAVADVGRRPYERPSPAEKLSAVY